MFPWMLTLSIGAVLAALLAFGGFTSAASGFAPALYFCFIVIVVGSLVWGLAPHRRTPLGGPR
jgi:uncharacterized membrane protein YtjA (UPF0391 family)